MRASRAVQVASLAMVVAVLNASAAGCSVTTTPIDGGRPVTAASQPASLLVVILCSAADQVHTAFRGAVLDTVRSGEYLVVVGPSGAGLGMFTAPTPPVMAGPAFPKPLPRGSTGFQHAAFEKGRAQALKSLRRDREQLRARQHGALLDWANRAVAYAWSTAVRQPTQALSVTRSMAAAMADVAALQNTGLRFGSREAVVLVDAAGLAPGAAPPDVALAGATIAVTGIADSTDDAAWQAALLQAGARAVYALPASAGSFLPAIVGSVLAGHAPVQVAVTGLSYGPAQYALPPMASLSLDRLLRLLTVTYPGAIASINGYTDNVPVQGGNLELSWKRAQAVLAWLVGHGVAANRLQAIGHGATDPVAPNMPGGQPQNRRVVVIVWPSS